MNLMAIQAQMVSGLLLAFDYLVAPFIRKDRAPGVAFLLAFLPVIVRVRQQAVNYFLRLFF